MRRGTSFNHSITLLSMPAAGFFIVGRRAEDWKIRRSEDRKEKIVRKIDADLRRLKDERAYRNYRQRRKGFLCLTYNG